MNVKKNVIIWGYGWLGGLLYLEKIKESSEYQLMGYADNNKNKNSYLVSGTPIYTLAELVAMKQEKEYSVIIASNAWPAIGTQLENAHISIEGVYLGEDIFPYKQMYFTDLNLDTDITLYAGDICDEYHLRQDNLYGLSLTKGDEKHIKHDITNKYPLPDNSIFSYQAEDVLEHIEINKVVDVINEIYRILKKGRVFRLSVPDYNSPLLNAIAMKDGNGNIVYDPLGGGDYRENGVINGGHVWFPTYTIMKELLEKTKFNDISFQCYYTEGHELVMNEFSEEHGYVARVHGQDDIYSMVVDCRK